MNAARTNLNELLESTQAAGGHKDRASKPCPCCGKPSARFYRVRASAKRAWGMACVLCAMRVLESSADAVLGGSAPASAVAASHARKRRRRERRAA